MQQATRARLAFLLAALGWISGCGSLPATATAARGTSILTCPAPLPPQPSAPVLKTKQTKRPSKTVDRPAVTPSTRPADPTDPAAPQPPAARPVQSAAAVRDALVTAITSAAGYSAVVTKSERDRTDGSWKTTQTRVISKRGDRVLVEALVHYKPSNAGVRLMYRVGSETVTVRPAGMLSFITKDFAFTDKEMLSGAGYRLDRFDFFAIAERLTAPLYDLKLLGKTTMNGETLHVLEVSAPAGQNGFDPSIVKERFGFDPKTHRIRYWEAYREGDDRVLRVTIDSFEPLASVPDVLLTL